MRNGKPHPCFETLNMKYNLETSFKMIMVFVILVPSNLDVQDSPCKSFYKYYFNLLYSMCFLGIVASNVQKDFIFLLHYTSTCFFTHYPSLTDFLLAFVQFAQRQVEQRVTQILPKCIRKQMVYEEGSKAASILFSSCERWTALHLIVSNKARTP